MCAKKQVCFVPKTLFEAPFIGSKFSHLLTVRAEVAAPPPHPPYGEPDRKISVFFTSRLIILDKSVKKFITTQKYVILGLKKWK